MLLPIVLFGLGCSMILWPQAYWNISSVVRFGRGTQPNTLYRIAARVAGSLSIIMSIKYMVL
jgi:hypothetical protein